MIVYQSTLEHIRSIIKAQTNLDIIDSISIKNSKISFINRLHLPIIRQIMQDYAINLNGLYLLKPIYLVNGSINIDTILTDQSINRPNTIIDKHGIDYTIWLESEASWHEFYNQFNPTLDAINMSISFADGDNFSFSIETFDFFDLQLTKSAELDLFETPDILIQSLDRPTIERMVAHLIEHNQLDDRFLTT
ncbi:hypothetical protein [Herpetosiphon geysericola]|uniref:Uncharacterized protein n=1 Tax=Herpetosiphon geysericola TaxID=70996 RepID=A0A0P6YXX6_9CHLR|nr:hypothetical protein [Herpetosiphon geysericola]KPL90095.1 hypothetical protein SE18_07705 [Herpetosiphon geysericola]